MTMERFPPPPPPSLPREAPWRELEETIELLKTIVSLLTGGTVTPIVISPTSTIIIPTPPGPAPEETAAPAPTPESEPTPASTADQEPITTRLDNIDAKVGVVNYNIQKPLVSRLDAIIYGLGVVSYKLDVVASLVPTLPALDPVTQRLDDISAKLGTLIEKEVSAPGGAVTAAVDLSAVIQRLDTIVEALSNRSSLYTNQKNVVAAGTPVQLDDLEIPIGCRLVIIAKTGNTGYIYFGNRSTIAQSYRRGDGLSAGLAVSLRVTNAKEVWIDSTVNGEGVSYFVER